MIFCEYALPIPGRASSCSFVAELMSKSSAGLAGAVGVFACGGASRLAVAETPAFPDQLARTKSRQMAALRAVRRRFAFMNGALLFNWNWPGGILVPRTHRQCNCEIY